MSYIVNVVLVKELLIGNPRGIRNDFIHPSAQGTIVNTTINESKPKQT